MDPGQNRLIQVKGYLSFHKTVLLIFEKYDSQESKLFERNGKIEQFYFILFIYFFLKEELK